VPDATSTDPVYPGATVLVGHLRGRQTKDAATLSGYKASGSQRLTMRAWMRDKDALVDKEDCLDAGIRFEGTEGDEGGEEEVGGADVDVDVDVDADVDVDVDAGSTTMVIGADAANAAASGNFLTVVYFRIS